MVARSKGRHVGLPLHRCGVEIELNHNQVSLACRFQHLEYDHKCKSTSLSLVTKENEVTCDCCLGMEP